MYKLYLFVSIMFITVIPVAAQKMIGDTIKILFGKESHGLIDLPLDSVTDNRKLSGRCVAINEKTKYLFVPIDQYVVTDKLVSDEIKQMFSGKPDSSSLKYRLEIRQFTVGTSSGFLSSNYTCQAAISLYAVDPFKNKKYMGTLLYENSGAPKRNKRILKNGYETIIDIWKKQFSSDIRLITAYPGADSLNLIANFRREQYAYRKNLLTNIEYIRGIDSWLIDGEIIFSLPEAGKRFSRKAYSLRYRNNKEYESYETTISNRQANFRLSENYVFILKGKMFFGLNRWKEEEYKKHGLEDLILLDYSLSQQITLNRFYKKGITLGLGVMEDLTYIYSQNISFKPYFIVQLGYKF
jgi:hypothetical protein